jgi:hypothetical protein
MQIVQFCTKCRFTLRLLRKGETICLQEVITIVRVGIENAIVKLNPLDRGFADMVAYELFSFDEKSGYEFIGILPERRKDPKRITNESVVNWGRMILGTRSEGKKIFFNRVAMEDVTGRAFD